MIGLMLTCFLAGVAFAGGAFFAVAICYLLGSAVNRRRPTGRYSVKLVKGVERHGF